ncbi:hypothetical protein N7478_003984 [Penicillium angulare]|uniref:uncharacterized protein n=1 Tax=Penicillium angulare TaxID=116970 RepID=UPI002541926E|nr:uncharacterized protein N7478_003984 [Penicillium angulare]KAJ5278612.1 hypothetical protein N7478_003984 [Penicillium angulare]
MAGTLGCNNRASGDADDVNEEERESDTKSDVLMDCITSGALSVSSQLDEFRRFFDLKNDYWNTFRERVKKEVEDNSTWQVVRHNDKQRRICAKKFLEKYGHQYWGSYENRREYLVTEGVENEKTCSYPDNGEALAAALDILMLKTAKIQTAKTRRASDGVRDAQPSSATIRPAELGGSATAPPAETSNNNKSAVLKKGKAVKKAQTGPSGIIGPGTNGADQEAIDRTDSPTDSTAQPIPDGQNGTLRGSQLATYFLVKSNISSLLTPVCVPFSTFKSSTDFINQLVAKCLPRGLSVNDSEEQFHDMQPNAVITLPWSSSKTPFVLRPDTDDLEALMARLSCAWTAQEQGKLQMFGFEVEVMLNFEAKNVRA